jgi:hypothetical protein
MPLFSLSFDSDIADVSPFHFTTRMLIARSAMILLIILRHCHFDSAISLFHAITIITPLFSSDAITSFHFTPLIIICCRQPLARQLLPAPPRMFARFLLLFFAFVFAFDISSMPLFSLR